MSRFMDEYGHWICLVHVIGVCIVTKILDILGLFCMENKICQIGKLTSLALTGYFIMYTLIEQNKV